MAALGLLVAVWTVIHAIRREAEWQAVRREVEALRWYVTHDREEAHR